MLPHHHHQLRAVSGWGQAVQTQDVPPEVADDRQNDGEAARPALDGGGVDQDERRGGVARDRGDLDR